LPRLLRVASVQFGAPKAPRIGHGLPSGAPARRRTAVRSRGLRDGVSRRRGGGPAGRLGTKKPDEDRASASKRGEDGGRGFPRGARLGHNGAAPGHRSRRFLRDSAG
jgi:hypothetical protein